MQRFTLVADEVADFLIKLGSCLWDTGELILDILLEFITRSIELAISVLALGFQILCFFRDLLFEAVQTFANTIRGTVNVVGTIDSEDVEDFASACIVIVLWIGAARFLIEVIDRNKNRYNPVVLFTRLMDMYHVSLKEPELRPPPSETTWMTKERSSRKKTTGSRGRRRSKKR